MSCEADLWQPGVVPLWTRQVLLLDLLLAKAKSHVESSETRRLVRPGPPSLLCGCLWNRAALKIARRRHTTLVILICQDELYLLCQGGTVDSHGPSEEPLKKKK